MNEYVSMLGALLLIALIVLAISLILELRFKKDVLKILQNTKDSKKSIESDAQLVADTIIFYENLIRLNSTKKEFKKIMEDEGFKNEAAFSARLLENPYRSFRY